MGGHVGHFLAIIPSFNPSNFYTFFGFLSFMFSLSLIIIELPHPTAANLEGDKSVPIFNTSRIKAIAILLVRSRLQDNLRMELVSFV